MVDRRVSLCSLQSLGQYADRRTVSSSVSRGQNNGLSKITDQEFDAAFNQTMIAGDLPDVRWGRIDYLNVTYLTTKWNIWQ